MEQAEVVFCHTAAAALLSSIAS